MIVCSPRQNRHMAHPGPLPFRRALLFWSLSAACCAVSLVSAADSLFDQKAERSGNLISERKARFKAGDIITVLVRETITASTKADTRTRKESDVESQADEKSNSFWVGNPPEGAGVFNPGELPNWKVESENEHRGIGQTNRTSEFTTTITCVVTQVFPNDTVALEGEKRVTINREDSTIIVHGLVRAQDVTTANTVLSSQMAGATVELKGKGPLWNNQRRGLLTRFLDWFSPF